MDLPAQYQPVTLAVKVIQVIEVLHLQFIQFRAPGRRAGDWIVSWKRQGHLTYLIAEPSCQSDLLRPVILIMPGLLGGHHGQHTDSDDHDRQRCFQQGEAASSHSSSTNVETGWIDVVEDDDSLSQPATMALILKIGRMIAMAMKPTIEPMTTIRTGSIMLVMVLMASRSAAE